MHTIDLPVKPREKTGKGPARRLRAEGRFPAIVYGLKSEPTMVAIDEHDFENHLKHGLNTSAVVNLSVEGGNGPEQVMLREIVRHPLTRSLRHADFLRVDMDAPIRFSIPVKSVGTSEALRAGALLDRVSRRLKVMCAPKDVPEAIEVPLDSLSLEQNIQVKDIVFPEGVTCLNREDRVVFAAQLTRSQTSAQMGETGLLGDIVPETEGEAAEGEAAEGEESTEEKKEEGGGES